MRHERGGDHATRRDASESMVERTPAGPGEFPGLLAVGLLARLPAGMGAVGLLAVGLARGYPSAVTGLLPALYTSALAVASPTWGRLVDRRGSRFVLLACVSVYTAGAATAVAPHPLAGMTGAALLGAGTPPVGAVMRATWNRLLPAPGARRRAAAVESVVTEAVHVLGRLAVAALILVGPILLLLTQAAVFVVGALGLAQAPALRGTRLAAPSRGGVLALVLSAARLHLTVLCTSAAHGAIATGIVAGSPGSPALGAVLLSAWAVGSALGGSLFARLIRDAPKQLVVPRGLLVLAVACPVALLAFHLGPWTAGLGVILLGLPIAPTFTGVYLTVATITPPGRENEAYALVNAVVLVAFGVGTTIVGALAGVAPPLVVGFTAAAVLSVVAAALARRLPEPT